MTGNRHPSSEIDVVLPARGHLPWLREALESLAQQTLSPGRVWLVDDGIDAAEMADDLGQSLLGKKYVRIANQGEGISNALNTGVEASGAGWIARMDADDIAHRERLAVQFESLRSLSVDVLGCGSQIRLVDESGNSWGTSDYPRDADSLESQLLQRSCFSHPTLVLRREALLSTPYRPALDGAEDVDIVLRLMERGALFNVDQPLLDYRVYVGQTNFQERARQTALQELAFRLAVSRASMNGDPLDKDSGLAERFVAWRLREPGYARARQAMTAFRYMQDFLHGGQIRQAMSCLSLLMRSQPWRKEVRTWIERVRLQGAGSLRHDISPFDELNAGVETAVAGENWHA